MTDQPPRHDSWDNEPRNNEPRNDQPQNDQPWNYNAQDDPSQQNQNWNTSPQNVQSPPNQTWNNDPQNDPSQQNQNWNNDAQNNQPQQSQPWQAPSSANQPWNAGQAQPAEYPGGQQPDGQHGSHSQGQQPFQQNQQYPSQYQPYQAAYTPYGGGAPEKRRGGLATAALVLGIIGLVLAVIPFANFAAYPLVVLAIIFGLLALSWGKAKAGLILGVLGLVATIGWTVLIGKVFNDFTNKNHTVVFKVSGTGTADITYDAYDRRSQQNSKQVSGAALPWSATVKVKGDLSGFNVSATPPNFQAQQLNCQIVVDGKVASSDESGDGSGVDCSALGFDGK